MFNKKIRGKARILIKVRYPHKETVKRQHYVHNRKKEFYPHPKLQKLFRLRLFNNRSLSSPLLKARVREKAGDIFEMKTAKTVDDP